MRKPRPEDYDPNYKPPRKPAPEAIDMTGIVPLSKRSGERANGRTDERVVTRTDEQVNARTSEPANGRTPERKPRTIRHSFQFFPEQIDALRRLRAEKALAGEQVDLSQLVREGLAEYLAKQ